MNPAGSLPPLDFAGARILLVDDEPAIRRSFSLYLERLGASVTAAADAREAIALLEGAGGDFDVLISDITLPGESGISLLSTVRRRWPGLPGILITGSLAPGIGPESTGAVACLQKPFPLSLLAHRVELALRARSRLPLR